MSSPPPKLPKINDVVPRINLDGGKAQLGRLILRAGNGRRIQALSRNSHQVVGEHNRTHA